MAYLRFASVYRDYQSVDDFEAEIAALRGDPPAEAREPVAAGAGASPDAVPDPAQLF